VFQVLFLYSTEHQMKEKQLFVEYQVFLKQFLILYLLRLLCKKFSEGPIGREGMLQMILVLFCIYIY